jgi:nudix-type nucleoside diphosphatase (YffH/AdpP family)
MAAHTIIGTRTIYEGWSSMVKLTIVLPDGRRIEREVEHHGNAVAVLPYDRARRRAMLVRQFRAPVYYRSGPISLLEAPAGLLDEVDPEACARREAQEEVGLHLRGLERVGGVWASPGISTEFMHLFLAPYTESDRTSQGGGLAEEHEEIEVVETALDDLWRLAEAGEIIDLKTLALVQALRIRHPELWA